MALCSMCSHGAPLSELWLCQCRDHNCKHLLDCGSCKKRKRDCELTDLRKDFVDSRSLVSVETNETVGTIYLEENMVQVWLGDKKAETWSLGSNDAAWTFFKEFVGGGRYLPKG